MYFWIVLVGEKQSIAADFETAISATGFGKFNILLFLIALPSAWSTEFDFTTMSYVLPAAQCDLEMTLLHKGMLNAITYLGMKLIMIESGNENLYLHIEKKKIPDFSIYTILTYLLIPKRTFKFKFYQIQWKSSVLLIIYLYLSWNYDNPEKYD